LSVSCGGARISFRVFRVIGGYIPSAVTWPVVAAFLPRAMDRRFLSDEHWVAEPGASANRREPLGLRSQLPYQSSLVVRAGR
jgi:hypothetical protein